MISNKKLRPQLFVTMHNFFEKEVKNRVYVRVWMVALLAVAAKP